MKMFSVISIRMMHRMTESTSLTETVTHTHGTQLCSCFTSEINQKNETTCSTIANRYLCCLIHVGHTIESCSTLHVTPCARCPMLSNDLCPMYCQYCWQIILKINWTYSVNFDSTSSIEMMSMSRYCTLPFFQLCANTCYWFSTKADFL